MDIKIDHIVSSDELSLDVVLIKRKLEIQEKLVVFKNNVPQFVISPISRDNDESMDEPIDESIKVGKFVQSAMKDLFKNNQIDKEEISNLLSREYSKLVFKMNFPVLKQIDSSQSLAEQKRDCNGYNRYYNFILSAYGKQYILCSQWFGWQYGYFKAWYQSINE